MTEIKIKETECVRDTQKGTNVTILIKKLELQRMVATKVFFQLGYKFSLYMN